jgi:hypothetical protein
MNQMNNLKKLMFSLGWAFCLAARAQNPTAELATIEKLYNEKNFDQSYVRAAQLAATLSQTIGANSVVAKAQADIVRHYEERVTRSNQTQFESLEPAYSMKGERLNIALTRSFSWESQDTAWVNTNAREAAEAEANRELKARELQDQLAKHIVKNAENILVLKAASIWAIRSGIEMRRTQDTAMASYADFKRIAKLATIIRFSGELQTLECETRTTARRKEERSEWVGVSFIIPITLRSSKTVEERPSITKSDCTSFKEVKVQDSLDSVYVATFASLDHVIDAWLELTYKAQLFEGWSKNPAPGFGNPYLGK